MHAFPELTVKSQRLGRAVVVAPRGEIDLATWRLVDTELASAARDAGTVVLDLREVAFMDTSGLRLLFDHQRHASGGGYRFLVVPGPPQVRRILDIAGLSEVEGLLIESPEQAG